ncbi:MAG TPA: hypothetical protein VHO29_07720 [Marmoricola sp.]|nr:hypothetical protein [Marmoricola sp.]
MGHETQFPAVIGSGVVIRESAKVHAGCVVADAAVVTHDIPDGQYWAGAPARPRGESPA